MTLRVAAASSPLDQLARVRPRPLVMAELPPARPGTAFVPERRNLVARERLMNRIRAEFQEMPGVCLTLPQARRLFGLAEDACARILTGLVREGLLRCRPDGTYGLRDARP